MATIKAGTYRFNDVLTATSVLPIGQLMTFTTPLVDSGMGFNHIFTCNSLSFGNALDTDGSPMILCNAISIEPTIDAIPFPYAWYPYGKDGWVNSDAQTITIPSDQEVSDEFYAWFTANAAEVVEDTEETPVATIIYGGSVIASLNEGQTATLKCAGMKMESDVVVEVAEQTESTPPNIQPLTITENGTYTAEDGVDGYSPITVEVDDGEGDFSADLYFEGGYAEVNLPNATMIKQYAFYSDLKLTSISMPKVTYIGNYAFGYNRNLAITELPSGLTKIDQYAFCECEKLALTSLPSGLTQIGNYAFKRCYALALTKLPSGITSLADGCFQDCTNLALTELPEGLLTLTGSNFRGCTKLSLTELPSTLTNIYSRSFSGCTGLTTLTFKGTPNTIYNNVFEGCTNLTTINVPWAEGAVANAPWGATNATINYNHTGG